MTLQAFNEREKRSTLFVDHHMCLGNPDKMKVVATRRVVKSKLMASVYKPMTMPEMVSKWDKEYAELLKVRDHMAWLFYSITFVRPSTVFFLSSLALLSLSLCLVPRLVSSLISPGATVIQSKTNRIQSKANKSKQMLCNVYLLLCFVCIG